MKKMGVGAVFIWMTTFVSTLCTATPFPNFITRSGDQLKDGANTFRFIGVNAPGITGPYDGYRNTRPGSGYAYDPIELGFEMESYFKDMHQMGATVLRNWGITVSDSTGDYESLVTGVQTYNETAFRKIDKMLQLCNQYNMRVILCLVKENTYWGGTATFSHIYGGGDYYTTLAVREGFKHLLKTMANRKNFYTGICYKDDKAILAWEFGNEVPNKEVEWVREMAAFLKSIDHHHLIADPRRANGTEQMSTLLNDVLGKCPDIDIVRTRQYPNYSGTVPQLWAVCAGKRPLIIDEFQRMNGFGEILEDIVNTGVSGGLVWSLMKNQYAGGIGGHVLFHSYEWGGSRWPGFGSGEYFNESKNLNLVREYSYKIKGRKAPPITAPADAPFLYPSLDKEVAALKWRCAPGAKYYTVERALSRSGPWINVSGDIDISFDLYYYPLFTDSSAVVNKKYYYRVKGKNDAGTGPPSNVIGPVTSNRKVVMDNLSDFSLTYTHSSHLNISSETWPRLRQTEEDYYQAVRTAGSESGEIVYKADQIKSIKIFSFSDKIDDVTIQYSADGFTWQRPVQPVSKTHRAAYTSAYSGNKNNPIDRYIYELNSFPPGITHVKIITGNAGAADTYPWIGRVHIGYTGSIYGSGK